MSFAIANLLVSLIGLYMFIIFAWVISSWLINFNIINTRNPVVYQIVRTLDGLVDPVVAPIRKVIPAFGGLDFSPIILLFALGFLRDFVISVARGQIL